MPVSPWAADSLAHVRDSVTLLPLFTVELLPFLRWTGGQNPTAVTPPASLATVPAWNVQVTLDGGRSPYGAATFSAPGDYISPAATSGYVPLQSLHPYIGAPVRIWAGYQRTAGPDLQVLFCGIITARRLRTAGDGTRYVEFSCETIETLFDFPSNRNGNVGNTWTSLKMACDTINQSATPWLRAVNVVEEAGQMNTPTSAQLTAWQAWQYQEGDSVIDTLIAWATALGQWVRGNPREFGMSGGAVSWAQLIVSANPDPYRAATDLTTAMFTDLDRVESTDQWANILNLSVSWTDPSSKDTKQKRATYLGAGIYAGAPNPTGQLRARDVNMRLYPPSGALPTSNYPPATEWIKRIGPRQEAKWSGTSRAMYWLQPRIDAVNLTDNGLGDAAGAIDSITWRLDEGTQTMTWTADAVYKP